MKPAALIFALLTSAAWCQAAIKPNIVLMYADNLGFGDLGCYGNGEVKTPRIDQLAAEGVRCTDFHVVSSTCTASRAALLTGRYPLRNGLSHQLSPEENWRGTGLPHRERIIPQYLKEVGFATACFGKWNIGFANGSRPTERGFDEFLGFRSGNINYFTHTYHGEQDMFLGIERHPVKGYSSDIFADAASAYIHRRAKDEHPFFIYLPFNAPHYVSSINMKDSEKAEWQAPAAAFERYDWRADDPVEKHRYLAVITALDDAVGRVLDMLDAEGMRDNTLVIFISDMGPILRPSCGLGVASAGIFRDGAPSLYEGGVRVPAIFRWPGHIQPGSVSDALLSHLDLLPWFLEITGAPKPRGRVLDGRSCGAALTRLAPSPHQRLVFHYDDALAMREGILKIVRPKANASWELYDLATDPSEKRNFAAERPNEIQRLTAAIAEWQRDVKKDASTPARFKTNQPKP